MPDADGQLSQYFYRSDKFTAASFVSHRADLTVKKLQDLDLLPKLVGKTLITAELAPFFRGKRDEMVERFAVLTRILDGDGYQTDSGAQGQRGYSGKCVFRWLGATTPLEEAAVEAMGLLGPRLLFFEVDRKESDDDDLANVVFGSGRELATRDAKGATQNWLGRLYTRYSKPVPATEVGFPDELKQPLVSLAKMLVRLRAPIVKDAEDVCAQTELPDRVASTLRDLAIARALIWDRKRVTGNDLRFVRHITLSSGVPGRQCVMRALLAAGGRASIDDLVEATHRSRPYLTKYIRELKAVGLVSVSPGGGRGNQTVVTLESAYQSVLLRPADRRKPETKKRWERKLNPKRSST
jgi:hypothetical protein